MSGSDEGDGAEDELTRTAVRGAGATADAGGADARTVFTFTVTFGNPSYDYTCVPIIDGEEQTERELGHGDGIASGHVADVDA